MEEEKTVGRLLKILRIGGYIVAGGAIVGFSLGLYLLLDHVLFKLLAEPLIRISQYEYMSYLLGVFMPSFVILIVIGYLFATTLWLKKVDLSNIAPLCLLSILCMVLSALSVFYFISFIGGLLTLAALISAYTKPAFKTLSKREAFFLMEIGALFVVSFSALFLSMWLLSNFFQTYGMGFYGNYSPYALLLVAVVSSLMFFAIPLWGSRGTSVGMCGALGSVMIILSYLFVVQNQYVLVNAPAYIGIFMLVLGFVSAVGGNLLYVRLFFFEPSAPTTLASSFLFSGSYCPHCGNVRVGSSESLCSYCGSNLMWTPYSPFCSSCGRLIPTNAHSCPHCREDIENKRIYFQLRTAEEHAIASKVVEEAKKEESWITKPLLKMAPMFRSVGRMLWSVTGVFNAVTERLSLTLKETVVIIILTYVLAFLSFIGYVRVEPSKYGAADMFIMCYGLPLDWLQVCWARAKMPYVVNVDVLWIPLALDIMLYFTVSLALVYMLVRIRKPSVLKRTILQRPSHGTTVKD